MTTPADVQAYGYDHPKQLATEEWAGVRQLAYTGSLFIGIDSVGYARRFCYASLRAATAALAAWDGLGDPPGDWIVEKGGRSHNRQGPGSTAKFDRHGDFRVVGEADLAATDPENSPVGLNPALGR